MDDFQNQLDCALELRSKVYSLIDHERTGDTITDKAEEWLYVIQGALNPIYSDYGMDQSSDTGFRIVYKYFKPDCQIERDIEAEYKGSLPSGSSYRNISTNLDRLNKFLNTRIPDLQAALENSSGKSVGKNKMELTEKTKALMGIKGNTIIGAAESLWNLIRSTDTALNQTFGKAISDIEGFANRGALKKYPDLEEKTLKSMSEIDEHLEFIFNALGDLDAAFYEVNNSQTA